jgi:hypothetical protein
MYTDRESPCPIRTAFSITTPTWIGGTPMSVDFALEHLSTVPTFYAAAQPEEIPKIV